MKSAVFKTSHAIRRRTFGEVHARNHVGVDEAQDPWLEPRFTQILLGAKDILPVPWLDGVVAPHFKSNVITASKSEFVEKRLPVRGPLAIDVMIPHLRRRCGCKKYQIAVIAK